MEVKLFQHCCTMARRGQGLGGWGDLKRLAGKWGEKAAAAAATAAKSGNSSNSSKAGLPSLPSSSSAVAVEAWAKRFRVRFPSLKTFYCPPDAGEGGGRDGWREGGGYYVLCTRDEAGKDAREVTEEEEEEEEGREGGREEEGKHLALWPNVDHAMGLSPGKGQEREGGRARSVVGRRRASAPARVVGGVGGRGEGTRRVSSRRRMASLKGQQLADAEEEEEEEEEEEGKSKGVEVQKGEEEEEEEEEGGGGGNGL